MKVAVLGGSGFLGQHVLAALGDDAVAVCRRPEVLEGVEARRADLVTGDGLADALAGCGAVIHAAGAVSHDPRDSRAQYEAHVTGTEGALAAAEAAGVSRFVHLSSSGTVAVSEGPEELDERAPRPLGITRGWPYYRAKLFAEDAVLAHEGALSTVILNPSLLLGPPADASDRAARGAASEVLRPLLEGRLPMAPSGGIGFVDVRDVARVGVRALRHGHPGRRYLLSGANWTFADFYARAARAAGVSAPGGRTPRLATRLFGMLPGAAKERLPASPLELEMASHYWWADCTRARAELDFRPTEPLTTLAEAVAVTRRVLDDERD